MIVVIAKVGVKPECRQAFIEQAKPVVEASRNEAGNISYTLYAGTEDAKSVVFVEEWQSNAALDAHMKETHFLAFRDVQKDMVSGEREIKVYEVAGEPHVVG